MHIYICVFFHFVISIVGKSFVVDFRITAGYFLQKQKCKQTNLLSPMKTYVHYTLPMFHTNTHLAERNEINIDLYSI